MAAPAYAPQEIYAALQNAFHLLGHKGMTNEQIVQDPHVQALLGALHSAGPADMGAQMAPPGSGEDLARRYAENVGAGTGAVFAGADRLVQPVAGAGARLAAQGSNDVLGTNFDVGHAGQVAEHAFEPAAPQSGTEAALRGAIPHALTTANDAMHHYVPLTETIDREGGQLLAKTPQGIKDAATVLSLGAGGGEAADAAVMRGADAAGNAVARAPEDVARAAGYTGLKSRADLATPGSQAITDKLIANDAGIVDGAVPNVAAVQNARKVGPGKVYDAVKGQLPANLSANEKLTADIKGLQDSTSQLPRSPDVEALKQAMLAQPNMTRDELFANIQQARERSATNYASEDPDKQALGQAYGQLAKAYEDFAESQLPQGSELRGQFADARTQFAKSFLAEKALKGGEHFDPMVYARAAQKEPDLLTGNAKIVADTANNLPAESNRTFTRAAGSVLGGAAGVLTGHALGEPLGGGIVGGYTGSHAAPIVQQGFQRIATRGNPEAAAATEGNPALSYYFGDNASPFAPRLDLTPPPGQVYTPHQPGLPAPAGPVAGVTPPRAPDQYSLALNPHVDMNAPPGSVGPSNVGPPSPSAVGNPEQPTDQYAADLRDYLNLKRPPGRVGPSPITNNASGESAASQEAINRPKRNVVQVSPDGTETPVLKDVTQVDAKAPKGHLLIDGDTGEILDRGGMTIAAANGLRNRWATIGKGGGALGAQFGGNADIGF